MKFINTVLILFLLFVIFMNASYNQDSFTGIEKKGLIDSQKLVEKLKKKIIEYESIENNLDDFNNTLIQ